MCLYIITTQSSSSIAVAAIIEFARTLVLTFNELCGGVMSLFAN